MTVAEVEMIEASYRAFRENDEDALLALYHPQAVWDQSGWGEWPEDPVYEGLAGIRRMLRLVWEVAEAWESWPREITPAGPGRYLVHGVVVFRGIGSGIEYRPPDWGHVVTFRDGLIFRVEAYSELARACRAAGLDA